MAKRKTKKREELDSVFFLKLVIYMIAGTLWVKVTYGDSMQIPIPLGPALGILFASHDHFQIDRKLEYTVLLMAALIGFWAPVGIFILL